MRYANPTSAGKWAIFFMAGWACSWIPFYLLYLLTERRVVDVGFLPFCSHLCMGVISVTLFFVAVVSIVGSIVCSVRALFQRRRPRDTLPTYFALMVVVVSLYDLAMVLPDVVS